MTDPINPAVDPAAQAPAPAPTAAPDPILKFTLPNIDGEHEFNVGDIPAEVRLDLLKGAVRTYIANRTNSAFQRHQKDDAVKAWVAYDEAVKADPLQTAVPTPTGERPADPDLAGALARAVEDLKTGNIRKQSDEPKARTRKDPLTGLVTKAVIRDVFEARKATDPKYSYVLAGKEVGADGIEYLNTMIATKVAAAAEAERPALQAALEKMRDTKYVNPAKIMLGLNDSKAMKDLPSIL